MLSGRKYDISVVCLNVYSLFLKGDMMQTNKVAVLASVVGMTIGFVSWLIVLGFVLESFLLIFLPLGFGIVCVWGAMKLYSKNPERKFSIMGVSVIWLMILNFFLANSYYEMIPETVWKEAPVQYSHFFI